MPRKRITKLHNVLAKIRREEGKEFRFLLRDGMEDVLDGLDEPYAGFAFVAWDRKGNANAVCHAGEGAIGPMMVPALAQTTLTSVIMQAEHDEEDVGS